MAAIECLDLNKTYNKGTAALSNVTLCIERNTSFGLLGENGAGKSTLVRILMGFVHPTSGIVRVLGEENVMRAHIHIGYVHEQPITERRFSGRAYLRYIAQLSGLWDQVNDTRVNYVLESVQLLSSADRLTGTYSKGMLQRLAIAQALIAEPEILILDEPTSGLDPRSQYEIRQIILALRKQGKTLFICSHYLTEVEDLCDTVGILKKGQLILYGTVDELLAAQGIVEIRLGEEIPAEEIVRRLNLSTSIIKIQDNILHVKDSQQQQVLKALIIGDIPIVSLNPLNRTLEEIYIQTMRTNEKTNEPEYAHKRN